MFFSVALMKKEQLIVDSKVYIFAMGMVQAFFKPNELPVLKQWEERDEFMLNNIKWTNGGILSLQCSLRI